jgi:hypothetical protein
VDDRETNGELPLREKVRMSETYRYYCLDGAGHLHDAEWLSAETDDDAIVKVEAKHPDGKCEIWQGARLAAKLEPMRRRA